MRISAKTYARIGDPASSRLQYRATLPCTAHILDCIRTFRASGGGALVLGVVPGTLEVIGLAVDFYVDAILEKVLARVPDPLRIVFGAVSLQGKRLFVIEVLAPEERGDSLEAAKGAIACAEATYARYRYYGPRDPLGVSGALERVVAAQAEALRAMRLWLEGKDD